ncbi:39S ribosomal protein L2, mitochondrial [Cataglyphis hispanica]|uniref:39S ribosomal protein L2, mitochondrial n=1 Tax=Cataglyphis hispanica TaxID=1086592 RepID=UPI00217FD583|nr:39S ribosomal protein L2, mitochondrial [Cataglyphis hispanica]
MSTTMLACRVFGQQISNLLNSTISVFSQVPRRHRWKLVKLPEIGKGKAFRRIVHFKDKYTVEPLQVTNLGGRDPVTGRVAVKGIGGGIKHKYHWINWIRDGPKDLNEPPKEEKVLEIFKDGCRTSFVALVGTGRELKYILATQNMKPGDIIRTHQGIPRNPVRPSEGDAYPLGALPIGTQVNCIEKYPGQGAFLIHAAGGVATIVRREEDRVVIQIAKKKLFSLHETCMATVGRLSNIEHASTPIGSAQKNRELGNRPRSGLFQRKTGRFGRKIKPPPKVKRIDVELERKPEVISLNSRYNA